MTEPQRRRRRLIPGLLGPTMKRPKKRSAKSRRTSQAACWNGVMTSDEPAKKPANMPPVEPAFDRGEPSSLMEPMLVREPQQRRDALADLAATVVGDCGSARGIPHNPGGGRSAYRDQPWSRAALHGTV